MMIFLLPFCVIALIAIGFLLAITLTRYYMINKVKINYQRSKTIISNKNLRWLKNNKIELFYTIKILSRDPVFRLFIIYLDIFGLFKSTFQIYSNLGLIFTLRIKQSEIPFNFLLKDQKSKDNWKEIYKKIFGDNNFIARLKLTILLHKMSAEF